MRRDGSACDRSARSVQEGKTVCRCGRIGRSLNSLCRCENLQRRGQLPLRRGGPEEEDCEFRAGGGNRLDRRRSLEWIGDRILPFCRQRWSGGWRINLDRPAILRNVPDLDARHIGENFVQQIRMHRGCSHEHQRDKREVDQHAEQLVWFNNPIGFRQLRSHCSIVPVSKLHNFCSWCLARKR